MSTALQRLYESLTQVFSRVPALRPVMTVDALAATTLTVADNTLTITSGVLDLAYDLRNWTFERLIEELDDQGVTATLVDLRLAKILAAALVDDSFTLTAPVTLSGDFNPLTIYLKPVAFAVERHEVNIDIALAQLNVLTSRQYFADYWGLVLGILRKMGESDVDYTQRIVDEILLKRDNNLALEQIIENEFGIAASVQDLWPSVLNINNAICFSKIAGEVYNVGNFLVIAELTDDDLIGLIAKHKAGGTRAFLRRTADAEFVDAATMATDFFDLSLFDAFLIPEQEIGIFSGIGNDMQEISTGLPVWTVGSTPMPGTEIA